MASSTLLLLLGIAVLQGAAGPAGWLSRNRSWGRALGGLALLAGVVLAVRAQGLAVGLTCAAVLAMLGTV
ncbi:hypothetical protein ACLESD_46265, partial [Pyxidicoccus sp. 3LFB2]